MALNRSPLAIIDGCHIRIVNVSFSGLSPSSAKQPVFIVKCTFQVLTFTQLVAKQIWFSKRHSACVTFTHIHSRLVINHTPILK